MEKSPSAAAGLGRIAYGLLFAWWLGGLAFYALFVIPLGIARWGAPEQGVVTAVVTTRLHWIAMLAIVCAIADAIQQRHRWLFAASFFLAVTQIVLFALHDQMSLTLARSESALGDGSFYGIHRLYLFVTTIQFMVGLALLVRLLVPGTFLPPRPSAGPNEISGPMNLDDLKSTHRRRV